MKRSEMIEKIKELISYEMAPVYANSYRAERILKEIEKIMKPPLTKRCPVLLTQIHTWENENEDKM